MLRARKDNTDAELLRSSSPNTSNQDLQAFIRFVACGVGKIHNHVPSLPFHCSVLPAAESTIHMVPKIADFGLSRCFDEKQSHVITSKLFGSLGYLAPEFYCGRITFKSDIYSLGVIMIEILTRERMYPEDYDTDGMNYPRHLFGSASVGHKAYLAGGSDCYGTVLSSVEIYDSDNRDWEILPDMNRARKLCSGVFMDGKLFVIGGRGSIKEELLTCGEEYDFERGSWRVIENMCEGLNRQVKDYAPPMVAVVSNELYGCDYTEKNVKRYDKENNRWITLGKWPVNVSSMNGWGIGFKACGDKLIIIGGRKTYHDDMVELHSWVPDGRPLIWKLISRRRMAYFVNATVMSC
nr:unnamed protein product [Digitaria exilis]